MAFEPHQDAHSATQWFKRMVFGFGLTSPKPRRRFPGLGTWFFWVRLVGLPLTTAGADGLSLAPWSAVQTGPSGPPSVRRGANAMMASLEQRLFAAAGAALAAEACEDASCEPVVAASFGADGCFGLHILHVSWSPGIWMFLVIRLFLEERTMLGWLFQCLAVHTGFFFHWFDWLWSFWRNKPFTIRSARFCGKTRVKVARQGWLHRFHERLRLQPGVGPRMTKTSLIGNLGHKPVAGEFLDPFSQDRFSDLCNVTGLPPNIPFDNCRGGAGGSAATARKRKENERDQALLQGLAGLLAHFNSTVSNGHNKGKGKQQSKQATSTGNRPRSGKGPQTNTVDTSGLLGALTRLVNRAQKKPEGLLDRLVALVDVASSGLNLEPEKRQKKRRRPQTEVKKGKGGAKASGKEEGQKGSASGPSTGKGSDLPAGSSWAHIVKGKKVSGDFSRAYFPPPSRRLGGFSCCFSCQSVRNFG